MSQSTALAKSLNLRGMSPQGFRVLRNSIWPAASSDESVLMAIDYCKARGLDPFKRQVHIVPVWSREENRMVDTIWPGISELRTTAARTRQYAGRDSVEYGPDVTADIGSAKDFTFPEWARCTLYRLLDGQRVPFHGDRVYFVETYAAKKGNDQTPNVMWQRRPRGQLAKCAEAAALRSAFPEEVGNEYAAEEMEGQTVVSAQVHQEPQQGSSQPDNAQESRTSKLTAALSHSTADSTDDEPAKPAEPGKSDDDWDLE